MVRKSALPAALPVLVAVMSLFVLSCIQPPSQGGSAVSGQKEGVAAIVGETPLNIADLANESPQFISFFRSKLIERMAMDKLAKEHVTITPEDIDEGIKKIKRNFPSEEAFQSQMKQMGIDEDTIRKSITPSLSIDKLLKERIKLTDEDVRDFYDKNARFVAQTYGTWNRLTEDETSKLTYDQLKDAAKDMLFQQRSTDEMPLLQKDLVTEYKDKVKLLDGFSGVQIKWDDILGGPPAGAGAGAEPGGKPGPEAGGQPGKEGAAKPGPGGAQPGKDGASTGDKGKQGSSGGK